MASGNSLEREEGIKSCWDLQNKTQTPQHGHMLWKKTQNNRKKKKKVLTFRNIGINKYPVTCYSVKKKKVFTIKKNTHTSFYNIIIPFKHCPTRLLRPFYCQNSHLKKTYNVQIKQID